MLLHGIDHVLIAGHELNGYLQEARALCRQIGNERLFQLEVNRGFSGFLLRLLFSLAVFPLTLCRQIGLQEKVDTGADAAGDEQARQQAHQYEFAQPHGALIFPGSAGARFAIVIRHGSLFLVASY